MRSNSGITAVIMLAFLTSCIQSGAGNTFIEPTCCRVEGKAVAERHRVGAIASRRFTQDVLWKSIEQPLGSTALTVGTIGSSIQGRPIRAVTFGTGPTTVLLWSQMHGDEPTATAALFDVYEYLAKHRDQPAVRRILTQLSL
ncbi:MAG: hypothetical protein M3R07_06570, partial [Gemmatimonadota bacterium]|nr:hypothetical protein [Gemmatimonadota bacterium]